MRVDDSKKNNSSEDKRPNSIKSINEKNEKQPVQPSNDDEDDSYEAQTLMDGVGSSYDEEQRNNSEDKDKSKK